MAPPSTGAAALHGGSDAYRAALAALFTRTTGVWRLGLERVSGFLAELGDPHRRYPVFHVAGTNGKGSTVATLDALLRHAGYRVGRYTSPHLVDFHERVCVNGEPMPPDAIVAWLDAQAERVSRTGATFFEVTTAMAFDWFAASNVDVAIIEVGLGGRLDATNVVDPVVSAVTSIGTDHVEYLGETIAEIAVEKAGVFKRGRPAIIGAQRTDAGPTLVASAERAGSAPILVGGRDWLVSEVRVTSAGTGFVLSGITDTPLTLHTPLVGTFQADNAAVALAMLAAAGDPWHAALAHAAEALAHVRLAGRFQRHGQWLFDVAHNPDGARTIVETLGRAPAPAPVWALVTVLTDKDWRGILTALAPTVSGFVITAAPSAPASRAWDPAEAAAFAAALGRDVVLEPNFDHALTVAASRAASVLVTGSFHTVGDAMIRLQVDPLAG